MYEAILFAPLCAAALVALGSRVLPRNVVHGLPILAVGLSAVLSVRALLDQLGGEPVTVKLLDWLSIGGFELSFGLLIDRLTALMACVVTWVSLAVHVYTVGYMRDDPGYARFFALIAFFTSAMLLLVMADNFMQLFVGWEAVGLASYLLIGFWFKRPSANFASLKAFLVNRIGDLGLLLGIALIGGAAGSLDYAVVFSGAPGLAQQQITVWPGVSLPALDLGCVLLFVGAMGKSAQMPLHIWLPDSMEGPTPISALIHAATMVTAGVFMVARMSPLFEFSPLALSVVLAVGATTALATGLVAIVQQDIKRIVAWSTLSQLGYMMAGIGVSAYSVAIYHLFTHAFFKALLFLAAGAVIVALHHEQDIRRMGGLYRRMPITYATALIGTLALAGIPGTAGFFSKDALISAVTQSSDPVSAYAGWCLLAGVAVTAFYSARFLLVVFHGRETEAASHMTEREPRGLWMLGPLVFLAVPSLLIGWLTFQPVVLGKYFAGSLVSLQESGSGGPDLGAGTLDFFVHGLYSPVFLLAVLGGVSAWVLYEWRPRWRSLVAPVLRVPRRLLDRGYGFDPLLERAVIPGTQGLARGAADQADARFIDGLLVNGLARTVRWGSGVMRRLQTGLLYHYAFVMVTAICLLIAWVVLVLDR
ncbi:MAG: NADH-quinone oxidoreductase subunit L [Gammaproteobacteria bacterium]|nr:NADH-quinone oxidoreductase subunit L [Gammaproteobacteria bacterium]